MKTCNFSKQKHVDPVRTTPRPCRYKPVAKFIMNPNEQLVKVMAPVETMEKFEVNSNE